MSKTGLALERDAIFEVFNCCRQPSTPGHQTDTQKGPESAPRPPKGPPKRQPSTPRPQTDTQNGPQISTPGLKSTSKPPTEVATQRWQPHTAQLIIIIIMIIIIIIIIKIMIIIITIIIMIIIITIIMIIN